MISLEMARKLRDAGLEWEPLAGDFYSWCGRNWLVDFCQTSQAEILARQPDPALWLPRLDQLLAEVEKGNYEWCLEQARDQYRLSLWFDQACVYEFRSDTPDDAAGQALLWILSQKEA